MRRTIAERARLHSPALAEALEERLFDDQDIAEELRVLANESPRVSDEFFTLLTLASAVEEL